MIVYRAHQQIIQTAPLLARLRQELARAERAGAVSHQQATEWLIDCGEFEAGVMDALCPEIDADSRMARRLRQAALFFGHIFASSWENRGAETMQGVARASRLLDELAKEELPVTVPISTPEGYVYYSLFPETYLEAAHAFFQELRPRRAVCIGIRSIGTSLSAVMGAALERHDVPARSYTVRPHGHPFDRRLQLDPRLTEEWRAQADAYFLIVDEGPGLSGSSLCCVAQRLAELGIADERIVFFPSWQPDGAPFVSAAARARWQKHRKYTVSFEEVWIESGRRAPELPTGKLIDISGGQWRSLFYKDASDSPAVQPQHERRKYLLRGGGGKSANIWLKFAGLGRYGPAKLPRAELLAAAGFAPRVQGFSNGFMLMDFVDGQPLTRADVCPALLTKLARYLAFLKSGFTLNQDAPNEALKEMARCNVAEGLGEQWAERLMRSGIFAHTPAVAPACAIDGRMLPHEWLRVGAAYVKTDGLDHHDDHFYPGCQDIAWDVAGSCIEFRLDRGQANYLINQYRTLAADAGIGERLPFYLVAYGAYRLGYSTLAANTLGESLDGLKFRALREHYAAALKREISLAGNGRAF